MGTEVEGPPVGGVAEGVDAVRFEFWGDGVGHIGAGLRAVRRDGGSIWGVGTGANGGEFNFGEGCSEGGGPVTCDDVEDEKQTRAGADESDGGGRTGGRRAGATGGKIRRYPPPSSTEPELFHVELSAIRPNPNQPRKMFDEESLRSLADSFAVTGVIQPVIVVRTEGGYELIAGERRFRAAQLAGMTRLPAIVRPGETPHRAEMALIENIHRQDLNPIERATAYRKIMEADTLTQDQLAKRLGEQRSGIANHLRLLELAQPVQIALAGGQITLGHAKVLASVEDLLRQSVLCEQVIHTPLSVRGAGKESQTKVAPGQVAPQPAHGPGGEPAHPQFTDESAGQKAGHQRRRPGGHPLQLARSIRQVIGPDAD